MSGEWLALGAAGALAAISAARRKESPSRLEDLIAIVGEIQANVIGGGSDWIPTEQLPDDFVPTGELLQRQLRAYGFEILGEGGDRLVVALGPDRIAKVALDSSGREQNWREYETWIDERNGPVADYLVPVHSLSGDDAVLVMELADPLPHPEDRGAPSRQTWQRFLRRRDELREHVSIYDADYDFNWGWHNGELKVLDYGNRW